MIKGQGQGENYRYSAS